MSLNAQTTFLKLGDYVTNGGPNSGVAAAHEFDLVQVYLDSSKCHWACLVAAHVCQAH